MITFIVGTDTDAGKTYYGKLKANENIVIKPIETGKTSFEKIEDSDCGMYSKLCDRNLEQINKYFFSYPASPHFAAEIDNEEIDINALIEFINDSHKKEKNIFVELAGGLMVPITNKYTQLDLLKEFVDVNIEVVVGNKLGAINHALLTLEVLYKDNIKVGKVIVNNFGKDSIVIKNNIKTIKEFMKQDCELVII